MLAGSSLGQKSDPDYMRFLLNGDDTTLAQRFARIDRAEVRNQLKEAPKDVQKYPGSMAKILKVTDLSAQF